MTDPRTQRAQARIGQVLCGKWTIDALLGAGGMAAVYSAVHRNGKRVALKVLHAELAADQDTKTRFLREGYLANKVEHRGCVSVLDDATAEDGAVFLVMELLNGETLAHRAERMGNRLPAAEVVALADQLLDVLAAAHDKGIIHRDIKPENLFVTNEGVLKVFDFGLARLREKSVNPTISGSVMGTPAFMSPEQALGKSSQLDGRTDLWSVGATMFTSLTGRLIHAAPTVTELLLMLVTQPVQPIATVWPGVPPALGQFIDRALAFKLEDRFPDARSMQSALRAVMSTLPAPTPVPARPDPGWNAGTPAPMSQQQQPGPMSGVPRPDQNWNVGTPAPTSQQQPGPMGGAPRPDQNWNVGTPAPMSQQQAASMGGAPRPDAAWQPAAPPQARGPSPSRPEIGFAPTAYTVPMNRPDLARAVAIAETMIAAKKPDPGAKQRSLLVPLLVGVIVAVLGITAILIFSGGIGAHGSGGEPQPAPTVHSSP